MVYALIVWRGSRGGARARRRRRRPAATSGSRSGWIVTTTVIVLGLFVFGTSSWSSRRGRRRRGPEPDLDADVADVLPIQVIGQQWKFTYRYPTFGGLRDQTS